MSSLLHRIAGAALLARLARVCGWTVRHDASALESVAARERSEAAKYPKFAVGPTSQPLSSHTFRAPFGRSKDQGGSRALARAAAVLFILASASTLRAQALITTSGTTTYTFSSSASLVNVSPIYENDANTMAANSNTLDIAQGTGVNFALGTFKTSGTAPTTYVRSDGAQTALQISYTTFSDKSDLGAMVFLFDTNRDSKIDDGDKGFAFNQNWNASGNTTSSTLTNGFSIVAGPASGTTATAYTPTTVTFRATLIDSGTNATSYGYYYQQSVGIVSSSGSNTAISFAVLLADIDASLAGTTVLYTAFSTGTLATGTYTNVALLDYYNSGTSGTGAFSVANGNAGAVLIPEPGNYAWGGTVAALGTLAAWRRRKKLGSLKTNPEKSA